MQLSPLPLFLPSAWSPLPAQPQQIVINNDVEVNVIDCRDLCQTWGCMLNKRQCSGAVLVLHMWMSGKNSLLHRIYKTTKNLIKICFII